MKQYNVNITLAIFKFDEKDPLSFSVGLIESQDGNLLLPHHALQDDTIEDTAKHLLRSIVYTDISWLNIEEISVVEDYPNILCVWRTYIPSSVKTISTIRWIEYARLETDGARIIRSHLKALRRAFNR